MRLSDLDLRELLEFEPRGGIIRFAGQRAVILDAVALGLLRKELIETVGATAARGVLTRFGYAHGWRTAENLRTEFPWDSEREWQHAGGRLHILQGLLLKFVPLSRGTENGPEPFMESIWHESYEAEQHLLHLGLADEPVCWTLCGFASGYLSFCHGREYYCREERCLGRGDAVCHMVVRSREDWGDAIAADLPFYRKDCLDATLRQVTETLKRTERRLRSRQQQLGRIGGNTEDVSGIVARSASMRRVLDLARRVARVDSTVLITGESGVGKERVARLIHEASTRTAGPFVAVNASAIPENLLESELFGHVRGAFTGATQDRPGLFEAANGGTLLLDEVGDVPSVMQAKLLRVLQEREVRRVGENRIRKVDVRVVAATNHDLTQEVAEKRFRRDLYYRLRVIELRIPPLRERKEDILPLARELLMEAAHRMERLITGLTPEVADRLLRYDWPGNVRELQNVIEGAVVLADGNRIDVGDLPEEVRCAPPGSFSTEHIRALAEIERDYILAVLAANNGNQKKTAAQLQIGTATLYRTLRRYKDL